MATAIKTDRTAQTIADLIEHRDAVAMDLATMGSFKQSTPWHLDRQCDLDLTNARLAMLGITPATTK